MHCSACGEKIITDALFCANCGQKVTEHAPEKQLGLSFPADQKKPSSETVSVTVPGGKVAIFSQNFFEYKGERINYEDSTRIVYSGSKNSINLIPVSQSYYFMVGDVHKSISISLGTSLYIGHKKILAAWGNLIYLSEILIIPSIVKKLAQKIFDEGEIVKIGDLQFSKNNVCYTKISGFFTTRREQKCLSWDSKMYQPTVSAGFVHISQDINGKPNLFHGVSISVENAVVIPQLIKLCWQIANRDKRH